MNLFICCMQVVREDIIKYIYFVVVLGHTYTMNLIICCGPRTIYTSMCCYMKIGQKHDEPCMRTKGMISCQPLTDQASVV